MAVESIWSHLKSQHEVYLSCVVHVTDTVPLTEPSSFVAVCDSLKGKYWCPVPEYPQWGKVWGCKILFNIPWHFGYQCASNEVVIGMQWLLHCRYCGIQVA